MHRSRPAPRRAARGVASNVRLIALAAILCALAACQTASGDPSGSRFTGAYGGISGGYGQGRVPGS